MNKRELDRMKALHRTLLQGAKNQLDNFYEEMTEDQQDRWLNEFRRQTYRVQWLNEQKPDDE